MKHLALILCALMIAHCGAKAQTISPEEFPTWKWVIEPKFDMASSFYEGFAKIKKQGKWGFIDRSGEFAIEPQFEGVKDFSDGMAAIKQNGKWGYINFNGEVVIPPKYYNVYNFTDDIARVERYKDDKDYYINRNGHLTPIIPEKNKSKGKTPTNRVAFPSVEKGKYGFVDKKKNWVIYPQFTFAKDFTDNVACVSLNGKWGYIEIATLYECVNMYIQNKIKQANHTDLRAELTTLFKTAMDNFKDSPLYLLDLSYAEIQAYDTVNKTYMITMPTFGELIISVDNKEDAASLKSNWAKVKFAEPTFDIAKNIKTEKPEVILTSVNIVNTANDKVYKWDSQVAYQYFDHINTYYYDAISLREAFGEGLSIGDVDEDEIQTKVEPKSGVIIENETEAEAEAEEENKVEEEPKTESE